LLAGIVTTPVTVTLLGSCSWSQAVRATSTAEVPDADARLRWDALRTERDLAALHTATAQTHADYREALSTYADLHDQHVNALRAEGPLPRLAGAFEQATPPDVPPTASEAVAAIVSAEQSAADALLAACESCQGPRLASVLATTAASDAGIAALMEALMETL